MVKPHLSPHRTLGLDDDAFEQRRPIKGQITKREVRAVSLYSLGLHQDSVVWDVGAGTGSISVEAALIANRGQVYAIERDTDSLHLLEANIERWSSGNVNIVSGEAPAALEDLPSPDSVFIGGSGGHLSEIIQYTASRLKSGGTIIVNLVVLDHTQEAYRLLKNLGLDSRLTQVTSSRGKDMPGGGMRLESLNPVFIVSGQRGR